ncbi:MAG: hypothetical protein Q8M92_00800 [Candidatus Subteraquimicrobiales bacterium]|nr:hypothetical protein [Candidatus Subteraquimicrobiales bacterium]
MKFKFKGWDKINNEWINVFRIILSKDGTVMAIEDLEGNNFGLHQIELINVWAVKKREDDSGVD